MNLLIITGSHRKKSETNRIANVLKKNYSLVFESVLTHNLSQMNLPYWDEGVWNNDEKWQNILTPIRKDIKKSDAFILITPEWGGMVPPKLKNYLLLGDQEIFGHKPALIISISAGMGGAYPVNELRTSGYKNTKINFIPEHIILRNVESLFVSNNDLDKRLFKRINYCINLLFEYAKAMTYVRNKDLGFEKYPYGM